MALIERKFEGQTNATAVTLANSGTSGDPAWSVLSLAGTATYSTLQARYGTVSMRSVIVAGTAQAGDMSDTAANTAAVSCWLYLVSYPSITAVIPERARDSTASGTNLASTQITTTGQVQSIAGSTVGTASVAVLALGTWYRLESVTTGANSASTVRTINIYDTSGALVIGPLTATGTTTAQINMIRWLKSGGAGNLEYFLDDCRQNIGASSELGARVQSITLAGSTETDAGQPLTKVKARTLGAAGDTSTAGALARLKAFTLGVARETDTAEPLGAIGPVTHVPRGSWYTLLSLREETAQAWRENDRPRIACPNDGEPLRTGPHGELYCTFDGWRPESS